MKTKVLISCAVAVQLICASVVAHVKSRFAHDVAYVLICIRYGSLVEIFIPNNVEGIAINMAKEIT